MQANPTNPTPAWRLTARIAFRFTFAYVLLFYLSFSAFFVPLSLPFAWLSSVVWGALVPWVSTALLGVEPPAMVSDGDGLAQWIMFVGCIALAAFAAAVWSWFDRARLEYSRLHDWLRVAARFLLGAAMFTYGLVKLAHLQMLPPHLAKLIQPLGESSPTSLLWIFMGSSAVYSAFTGLVELVGGLLLFNRRTTTLGALLSFGAMIHVVVLNLAYDVSVKIWSMNLTALALVLLVPELRRLTNVLVLNRPSLPVEFRPLLSNPRHDRILFRIGMVCLVLTLGVRPIGMLNGRGSAYSRTPTALWGIHQVQWFSSDGVEAPPLITDSTRWRLLVIERSGLASVRYMDDSVEDYLTRVDEATSTVSFVRNPDPTITTAGATRLAYDPSLISTRFDDATSGADAQVFTFQYTRRPNSLSLEGRWSASEIAVRLSRVDETNFLLLNRGFHWVQSYPYFR